MNTRKRIIKRFYSESIRKYNAFADRAMSEPEYESVKDYALNAYFKKQEPARKEEVAGAYARLERNYASSYDLRTIMDYYQGAEKDYRLLTETRKWVQEHNIPEPIRERFVSLLTSCYVLDIARDTATRENLPCQTGEDICGLLAIALLNAMEVEHIDNEARERTV